MSRIRVTPNCEALFVGPAPASGCHFINVSGILNNNYSNLVNNHNLVMELYRVINFNYNFTNDRVELKHLGKISTLANPVINRPLINISFDYLLMGLINEARMGLNVNYSRFEYPYNGSGYYGDKVFLLSGLNNQTLTRDTGNSLNWPYSYRDKRNLFVAIAPEGKDEHSLFDENFINSDTLLGIDPLSNEKSVLSFGNCYLSSYSTSASVGDFPRASINYIAENMQFNLSGSGINIPAIEPKTGTAILNKHFVIPATYKDGGPSVLLPGDIDVLMQETGNNTLYNLSVHVPNAKINNYSIAFNIKRKNLDGLGYRFPMDRPLDFPIPFDVSFNMIVGDGQTGSLINLFNYDNDYNVTIMLHNPISFHPETGNPSNDGITKTNRAVAIRYDGLGLKFRSLTCREAIGTQKTAEFRFQGEFDPENFSRGLFISGLLNFAKTEDFLVFQNTTGIDSGLFGYLLGPDSKPIVIGYPPIY